MTKSKYELREKGAQEIMSKPPHAFISRGNIFVLSILAAAFYFLNKFPLYEIDITHFQVTRIDTVDKHPDSVRLTLSLNTKLPKNVNGNQQAKLFIDKLKFNQTNYLSGWVDSIGYTAYEAPVLYFKCSRSGLLTKKGMIGDIEIIIKTKTFLSMLLDRFRI